MSDAQAIHANNIGYMVGSHEPTTYYTECPSCGGDMRRGANLCHSCYRESVAGQEHGPDEGQMERRRMYDALLKRGWTVQNIQKMAAMEKLYVAWLIARWCEWAGLPVRAED